jgi:hypothetical protein
MFKLVMAVKFIVLLAGFYCLMLLVGQGTRQEGANIGIGLIGAACIIAFALIENNGVRESNKE